MCSMFVSKMLEHNYTLIGHTFCKALKVHTLDKTSILPVVRETARVF